MKKLIVLIIVLTFTVSAFGVNPWHRNYKGYTHVWYHPTYETIHATFAAFDTACVKIDTTGHEWFISIYDTSGVLMHQLQADGDYDVAGNILMADQKYIGLDGGGRIIYGDDTVDTLYIDDAVLQIGKPFATGEDVLLKCSKRAWFANGLWLNSSQTMLIGQTGNAIGFYNNTAYRLYVNNNGHIGIGTTDPDNFLSLYDSDPSFCVTDSDENTVITTQAQEQDTSAIYFDFTTEPLLGLAMSDGDKSGISGNTSDQMLFKDASGGYVFDDDLYINSVRLNASGKDSLDGPVVAHNTIPEKTLKAVNAPADEDIFTYESTTGDFEWHTPAEIITAGTNLSWSGTTLNATAGTDDSTWVKITVDSIDTDPKVNGHIQTFNSGTHYRIDSTVTRSYALYVCIDTVDYTTEANQNVVALPAGSWIMYVNVKVLTAFNDSGTDVYDIGYTGNQNRYGDDVNCGTTVQDDYAWAGNLPERMTSDVYFVFDYEGQNNNASAGQALVLVWYIIPV